VTSWEGAYDVRQEWGGAVAEWFGGHVDAAQAGIESAWARLQAR
jgi:hypothetical protein